MVFVLCSMAAEEREAPLERREAKLLVGVIVSSAISVCTLFQSRLDICFHLEVHGPCNHLLDYAIEQAGHKIGIGGGSCFTKSAVAAVDDAL